jgi:hypothetical protein
VTRYLDAVELVRKALTEKDGGSLSKDSLTVLAAVQELRGDRDTLKSILKYQEKKGDGHDLGGILWP